MTILVSACLLGRRCRYDGQSKACKEAVDLIKTHTLIPICPEQSGGLKTPREPAERKGERVVTKTREDVTGRFEIGAEETLELASLYGCHFALLKERSPSCGRGRIYDGSFTGRLIDGRGVTAELLEKNGICVFGESQVGELLEALREYQARN